MHVIEWILKEPGVQDGLLMVIGLACIMAGGYVAFGPGGGMIVTLCRPLAIRRRTAW